MSSNFNDLKTRNKMKAEHFIENNYHTKAGLEADKLIEDKTGKEVSFEEIAEAYHEHKLKLLGIADVSQQRELFYNFITWYNAIPKMDKPKNGLITTDIIEKHLKL